MAKPIWELEPEGIDVEFRLTQQTHPAHTQAPGVVQKQATTPVEPQPFASGTNRARGAGRAMPPPLPAKASKQVVAREEVVELEADFDEHSIDVDFAINEFDGVVPTAETPAQLLQQLKKQSTAEGGNRSTRVRRPAEGPVHAIAAATTSPTPTQRHAAASTTVARAGHVARSVVSAKSSLPMPTPSSSQTSRNGPLAPAPKPASLVPDTSYSVVRKQRTSVPGKKRNQ